MKIHKSYRIISYLNRRHSKFTRYLFGIIGWIAILIITRSIVIANLIFREFVGDNYLLAMRLSLWIINRFSKRFSLIKDEFYDFTTGTSIKHREAFHKFLARVRQGGNMEEYLVDCLYISAANLHENIELSQSNCSTSNQLESFFDQADELLSLVRPIETKKENVAERQFDFSVDVAAVALQDFADELDVDKWPWYVISGTLLGLHREGDFLKHDYDIDIGINSNDIILEEFVCQLKSLNSFVVKKIDCHLEVMKDGGKGYYMKKTPSLVKIVHCSGMHIDVFLHHHEKSTYWHGSVIHRWENSPFELERRLLRGVVVNAPKDADLYLTENYGNWKTPIVDFECTTGTPNLVISRNLLSISLFIKKLIVASHASRSEYDKLKEMLVNCEVVESIDDGLKFVRGFVTSDRP